MRKTACIIGIVAAAALLCQARTGPPAAVSETPDGEVTRQMIVTVEARHGKEIPQLKSGDFSAWSGKERLPVSEVLDLQDPANAGLELFVLLDDSSATSVDSQLGDLKHFMELQPSTTSVAVGYIRNGTVNTVQNFTPDHALAASSLRIPLSYSGAIASPYLSLSDLVQHWPASSGHAMRREIVMVSSGIDPLGGLGPINPYRDKAIHDAQRAGVIVYTIYTPASGHAGHSYFRVDWGQNDLAELADKTGGEYYILGFGAPVSFAPYLDEITAHLAHQYRVSVLVKPEKKADYQPVRFSSEVPNSEIVSATDVYAPAHR